MKKKLKHILSILTRTERRQFWIQIGLNIFISIADIALLALLLLVINFYINNSGDRLDFLPSWMLDSGSVTLIAIFLILFSIKNLLGIMISNAQFKFSGQVAVRISKQKLDSYLHGSFTEFVNIDSAEHIRKIAFQPFEFCQHILTGIQQIIIQSFLILITIIAILLFNAKLFFLLFLILLPPVTLVFFFIKRKVSAGKKNIHSANENSFRYLLDALKGYVESNIYNRNDFFLHRFTVARQQFSKYLFNSLSVQAMPGRIIETFAVLGLFILIVIVKWSGVNDSFPLITIGAFMAGAYKIIPGIVKIINAAGQMKAYDFSIYDLGFGEKDEREKSEIINSVAINSVEFKDVGFSYDDQNVLNKLSFKINKGDFVGITGKSGKGKTTILNLLIGFLSPKNGEILINDKPASFNMIKDYWPVISYVRQQPFLIHDTILRNIILEEASQKDKKLEQVLAISGVNNFINRSADGLSKMITENGKNISGGQQQRIAIARALYKDAELVILDEPFNELDETSTLSLVNYFKELSAAGNIVIMVTHDNKSLSYCNKIISLDE
ncbi:MAG TPA: ABC transporter ATP-binding protein [Chitinophagaceae bacterium]|nr:ABC transporter ATP-binding protein [Chitinophagaceae bacterium]